MRYKELFTILQTYLRHDKEIACNFPNAIAYDGDTLGAVLRKVKKIEKIKKKS